MRWTARPFVTKSAEEYYQIVKIIENVTDIDLFQDKEILRREYEGIFRSNKNALALKATRSVKGNFISVERNNKQVYRDVFRLWKKGSQETRLMDMKQNGEQAYTLSEQEAEGWWFDSSASSQMCSFKDGFV